jgi:hypothetical protein
MKIPEGRARNRRAKGVYDIAANQGWVNVGIDADTAEFAVESIRRWWQRLGSKRYPKAPTLTITADCGGSNGARVRLWKQSMLLPETIRVSSRIRDDVLDGHMRDGATDSGHNGSQR